MKKAILLIAFSICIKTLNAQVVTIEKFERIHVKVKFLSNNPDWINIMVLSNGDTLKEGSKLKLGKGTLPNGDYEYIATPSNTAAAKLKRTTTMTELKIIELNRKGDEKYGYKYFIKTEGGYLIQLESAAATKEILF